MPSRVSDSKCQIRDSDEIIVTNVGSNAYIRSDRNSWQSGRYNEQSATNSSRDLWPRQLRKSFVVIIVYPIFYLIAANTKYFDSKISLDFMLQSSKLFFLSCSSISWVFFAILNPICVFFPIFQKPAIFQVFRYRHWR